MVPDPVALVLPVPPKAALEPLQMVWSPTIVPGLIVFTVMAIGVVLATEQVKLLIVELTTRMNQVVCVIGPGA